MCAHGANKFAMTCGRPRWLRELHTAAAAGHHHVYTPGKHWAGAAAAQALCVHTHVHQPERLRPGAYMYVISIDLQPRTRTVLEA